MSDDLPIWVAAILSLLIAVTAFYLSSRHQALLAASPSRTLLRGVRLAGTVVAYLLFCRIVTALTAFFILILFAMVMGTLLPLLVAYITSLRAPMS